MEAITILKVALMLSGAILLLALTYFVIEGIRLICRVRKMMDRLMFVTDVREWVSFFKLFQKKPKVKS